MSSGTIANGAPTVRVPRPGWRPDLRVKPEVILPIITVGAILAFTILAPTFLSLQNFQNLSRQWASIGILALGAAIVILAGGVDISFAATAGLVSVVTAEVAVQTGSPWALLVAIPVGLGVGVLNGTLVAVLRMSPIVVTLGSLVFIRGLANVIAGGTPIYDVPQGYGWIGTAFLGPVPVSFLIALAVAVFDMYLLQRTRFGLRVYATGDNATSATISGVNPYRVLLATYLIAGLHWAVAGALLTSRVNSGQASLATGYEVTVLTAVFLGGVSLVGGSGRLHLVLLASILLAILANGLNLLGVYSFIQQVIFGTLLIVAMLLTRFAQKRWATRALEQGVTAPHHPPSAA
jgi:ribose/xylose/arabinose/galactoside ABC-type transport system permease subunit